MKYIPITTEITNFKMAPAANPKKEPNADFSACACGFPHIFSPMYAPRNGHPISQRIPNGPTVIHNIGRIITAMISQMVLQVTQLFVPPNFLVPMTGMT